MNNQVEQIKKLAVDELSKAVSQQDLDAIRVKYLGKKGELTSMLKQMGKMLAEERPIFGQKVNEAKGFLEDQIAGKIEGMKAKQRELKLRSEKLDVTLPGTAIKTGNKHPLTIVLDEIKDIFVGLGFEIADGPEVEYDYYNFEALNIPKDHPARDTQDTFYINDNVLLRTQTSSCQIRVMENKKPPIRMIAPGRVYRSDALDATHSPLFHQIEGLVVDKGVTMGDLKGTLEQFVKCLYGEDAEIRLRPHHFPFTEPSCEVDFKCFNCGGKGCSLCKGEGWIEILGAGMVHPKVLENCGVDPNEYTGFAFGLGLERIAMRRFHIDDIRKFYEDDLRFISQF